MEFRNQSVVASETVYYFLWPWYGCIPVFIWRVENPDGIQTATEYQML
jgi:hypothetical protein